MRASWRTSDTDTDSDSDPVGAGPLKEGVKVEARYGGRSHFYPGKIRRENRDGTYDIHYEDGSREKNVRKELIKALEPARGNPPFRAEANSNLEEESA